MTEIQPPMTTAPSIEGIAPALARDLAQDFYLHEEIAERHGLTVDIIQRLLNSKSFQRMVTAAKGEWAAVGNSKTRATLKAQLAVEEALPDLFRIIQDEKEAAPARVAAFAQLKEVGQFEKAPPERPGAGGPGFAITINLGAQSLNVAADLPPVVEGAVSE